MDAFLQNISSFPVSIFTVGLGIVISYWLVALFGLFDWDIFSAEVELEINADIGQIGTIAGLLATLGLSGVPITIVISLLILNAWFVCYYVSKLIPSFPDVFSLLEISLGLGSILLSLAISTFITAAIIKPLRPIFRKLNNQPISRSVIGRTCRVRSSRVDQSFGEVECVYQGASLILKVRSIQNEEFKTGDMVVLIEHVEQENAFLVVNEKEFNQQIEK